MARKGLPAKYIRAAWKTKGATKKNALKRAWAAYRKSKNSKKSSSKKSSKKTKRRGNPNNKNKGGRKTANNGIRIPSLPTMAKVGVAGLWLATRQTGYGNPLAEIQNGNYMAAGKALLQNARDVIMTAEGWTQVIAPIVAISFVQKIVPKTRVNIMGVNWSIM